MQLPVHVDVAALVRALGPPAAGLGILLESAGVPFPGETMMLVASAFAASGRLDIRVVTAFAIAGTLVGADLGYLAGHRGGRPFVERVSRGLRLRPDHLARSELFFTRYGAATILFARFVFGLRTWASVLAGMSRMPFWTYQVYSAVGGVVWCVVVCGAGYLLGRNLGLLERVFSDVGYVGVSIAAAALIALWLYRRRALRSGR